MRSDYDILASANDAACAAEIKAMNPDELLAHGLKMQKAYDDLMRAVENAVDELSANPSDDLAIDAALSILRKEAHYG